MSINRIFWQLRASLSKLIVGSRHKLDVTISITYAATADSSRETNSRRVGAESVPGNGPARKIVSRICNANTPYLALGGQWDSLVWTLGKGRTSKKGGGKIGRRSKNRFLLPFFFFSESSYELFGDDTEITIIAARGDFVLPKWQLFTVRENDT